MDTRKVVAKGKQMGATAGAAGVLALLLVSNLLPNLTEFQSNAAVTFVTIALAAVIRMAHNYLKHRCDGPPDEYGHS